MRNAFAERLLHLMSEDDRIFLLYGDIGNRLFDAIKHNFPERIENAGIAEASMVGVAAGLSQANYIPFCYTINSFLYLKALEQIKLDIAYPNRHVVLVGTGGGLSYGSLGTSHHSVEDYGVLGSIPNLQVCSPADVNELHTCLDHTLSNPGPSYIRLGKKGEPQLQVQGDNTTVVPKRGFRKLSGAPDATRAVVSIGPIGAQVQDILRENSPDEHLAHFSFFQIEPWLPELVTEEFSHFDEIVVVEEHYKFGGLATRFMDTFHDARNTTRITSLGLDRGFFTGAGGREEIRESFGLSKQSLINALQNR